MSWNPNQYLKFAAPRLRPQLDLIARIALDAPRTVFDLGCGTGSGTRMLAQRWPDADVTGVDASAAMLAKAAQDAGDGGGDPPGRLHWQQASIADWQPGAGADLIYSNAALHWLGDHARLFPHLMRQLAPGGVLAVQMPRNFDAPSHRLIDETVAAGPWRERLQPLVQPSPVGAPADYYGYVAPLASELDLWETEYLQVLAGPDPVKEWTKGTWLPQFLDRLPSPAEQAAFEADYAERLRAAYPMRADGTTLFPFKRLFIVARRAR